MPPGPLGALSHGELGVVFEWFADPLEPHVAAALASTSALALIGGGKLGIQHGHYRKYDEATPFSNVFVGMLNAVGVKTEAFADSTAAMPEIFG